MVHVVPSAGLSTHAVLSDKNRGVWDGGCLGSGRARSMGRIDYVERRTEGSSLCWLSGSRVDATSACIM